MKPTPPTKGPTTRDQEPSLGYAKILCLFFVSEERLCLQGLQITRTNRKDYSVQRYVPFGVSVSIAFSVSRLGRGIYDPYSRNPFISLPFLTSLNNCLLFLEFILSFFRTRNTFTRFQILCIILVLSVLPIWTPPSLRPSSLRRLHLTLSTVVIFVVLPLLLFENSRSLSLSSLLLESILFMFFILVKISFWLLGLPCLSVTPVPPPTLRTFSV